MLVMLIFFLQDIYEDYRFYNLNIPDFSQLDIAEGKIKITFAPKVGVQSILVKSNKKTVSLYCNVEIQIYPSCFLESQNKEFKGKIAKVWFYKYKGIIFDDNLLFQVEVEGKTLIDYQTQRNKYILEKNKHLYLRGPFLLLVFIIIFISQKRSEISI